MLIEFLPYLQCTKIYSISLVIGNLVMVILIDDYLHNDDVKDKLPAMSV